jgi:hypothetical protein
VLGQERDSHRLVDLAVADRGTRRREEVTHLVTPKGAEVRPPVRNGGEPAVGEVEQHAHPAGSEMDAGVDKEHGRPF